MGFIGILSFFQKPRAHANPSSSSTRFEAQKMEKQCKQEQDAAMHNELLNFCFSSASVKWEYLL